MRATFLQFRNPKEQTPAPYFPQSTTEGRRLLTKRFNRLTESESRKGSFSRCDRFNSLGSIYKNVVDRTGDAVGPGSYKDDPLSAKPCMTTIHRPEVAMDSTETFFDLHGHVRVLQTSYMPRRTYREYSRVATKIKGSLGRKVNDTLIFRRYRQADYCPGDSVGSLKARALYAN